MDNSDKFIINALTYNLLYKVAEKSANIKNIVKNILKYENVDIVSFQEIGNKTKELILKEVEGLKFTKIIKCRVGRTSVMTILNSAINLKAVCWNSFETIRRDTKGKVEKDTDGKIIMNRGRPFQILVCEYMGLDLLILNCHFPHIKKKDLNTVIVKKLTQNLTFGVKIDDSFPGGNPVDIDGATDIELDNSFKKQNISDLIVGKKFKVLMLGDFNDVGKLNLYQGFRPFKTEYSKYLKGENDKNQKQLNLIKLGGSKVPKPPSSCCLNYSQTTDSFSGRFSRFGDYTIVDSSIQILQDNYVSSEVEKNASDHLPVAIKVKLVDEKKSSSPKNSQGKTKKKFICKLEKFKVSKSKKK